MQTFSHSAGCENAALFRPDAISTEKAANLAFSETALTQLFAGLQTAAKAFCNQMEHLTSAKMQPAEEVYFAVKPDI